ncbi:MAG: flagella assembly protein FlgT middle domain-containing protein [Pseudomonadota bacterium]
MGSHRYHYLLFSALIALMVGCAGGGGAESVKPESKAAAQEQEQEQPSAAQTCPPEVGTPHYYRKALLVAGTTSEPNVAPDLPGVEEKMAARLKQHLEGEERFVLSSAYGAYFAGGSARTAELVRDYGREHGAQFVVKLGIDTMALHHPNGRIPLMGQSSLSLGEAREVQLRLVIYDGQSGERFHSRRYQKRVSGDVVGHPGEGLKVSGAWFNTVLGKEVDALLAQMSREVVDKLACIPFTTTVVGVEGTSVHLDAGHLQGLRPGDTLRVYRLSERWLAGGVRIEERAGPWLRVKTVHPTHSVASLGETGTGQVRVGDAVRAW